MKIKSPFSLAVAIGSGLIVLLSYLFQQGLVLDIRDTILKWVVIGSAAALIVGFINLMIVHINKIREGAKPFYSFLLVSFAFLSFSLTLALGPGHSIPQAFFQYIQIPVETSLMAVMAVTLTYAISKLLSQRPDLFSVIFILAVLVSLLGMAPFFNVEIPFLSHLLRPFFNNILANAGARGLMIGVGLGTLTTGLRILLGADRPYSN